MLSGHGRSGCRAAPTCGVHGGGSAAVVHPRRDGAGHHAARPEPDDPAARVGVEGHAAGRSSRHVELTSVGELFLGQVERVLGELDRAFAAVRNQIQHSTRFQLAAADPWAQNAVTRFERATAARQPGAQRRPTGRRATEQDRRGAGTRRGAVLHRADRAPVSRVARRGVLEPLALAGPGAAGLARHPEWPLVVNIVSGTTGPWSGRPARDHGPSWNHQLRRVIESVAADRGIGVVPKVAMRRNIHSAVTFLPVVNAPPIPVSLAFLPRPGSRCCDSSSRPRSAASGADFSRRAQALLPGRVVGCGANGVTSMVIHTRSGRVSSTSSFNCCSSSAAHSPRCATHRVLTGGFHRRSSVPAEPAPAARTARGHGVRHGGFAGALGDIGDHLDQEFHDILQRFVVARCG